MSNRNAVGRWNLSLAVLLAASGWGCHLMVDPFRDELAAAGPVTTPSAEAARAAQAERRDARRPFAVSVVDAEGGAVTHGALYFEDPCETTDVNDSTVAWTGQDFACAWIGCGRFLVNIGLFPLSLVDTPPWQVMSSDGQAEPRGLLGEEFDARKGESTDTSAYE